MTRPLYLFLDFDGVLHPDVATSDQDFQNADRLGRLIDGFSQIQVIVSSTQREMHDLDELRTLCGPSLGLRIVGVTPVLRVAQRPGRVRPPDWYERHDEIALWLAGHAPTGHEGLVSQDDAATAAARDDWIALDDWPHFFPHDCPQLVLVDREGFDEVVATALHERLTRLDRSDPS